MIVAMLVAQALSLADAEAAILAAQSACSTCATAAARRWTGTPEAAETIAEAAMGQCGSEEAAADSATRQWMVVSGGGSIWVEENIDEFRTEMRQRVRRYVLAAILDARAQVQR